ncbi:Putative DNA-binding domain-containing protein [Caloramator quimbayensis]|uniref:Putative DNA-binding domain-containing protein n=1 Tax=Caloramator quimbayensis TaxID=1147123 RepID=A0A1T4X7W8_9CLOT|nr:RNA-binding domain-containing protein [Caloramator quimbayensis]SKA85165.1 Putative DNA-binding domain-containing protein [Caloramator quimbayensis]
MDIQKLIQLLSKEEGPKLDFKLKLFTDTESSKKELSKDVCAIANSRGGRGYILFGIEDKTKRIVGINKEEFDEEQIQQIVSTRTVPPVPISVEIINFQGKDIGIITIYSTEQKPHQIRDTGSFYIRRGSTTDIMHKEEIASMMQDNGLITFELLPVAKAAIKDLSENKIKQFLLNSNLPIEINKDILSSTGIITIDKESGEYHPSCGGMLLFGKYPQNFLPFSLIKIHNNINFSYPQNHISIGTIIEMLDSACEFIFDCLNEYHFPKELIQNLLAKAVIYRDYFEIYNCVEVNLNKSSIEIINPGFSTKGFGKSKDVYSKRNMWLYLKFLSIDIDKRYFNNQYNIKEYRSVKFYNILSRNLFKAVIPITKIKGINPLKAD